MKQKTQLTTEQLYKKNQFKSKWFKKLAPVIFWSFLGLFILFMVLTIANSWGNISEIISALDKKKLSGEQVAENYENLVAKWGEWIIIGDNSSSVSIRFIDIRKAFFSGLMITYIVLAIVCLAIAIIVGKILFPKLAQYYSDNNQSMVDLATLQTNAEIQKQKNKKEEDRWF